MHAPKEELEKTGDTQYKALRIVNQERHPTDITRQEFLASSKLTELKVSTKCNLTNQMLDWKSKGNWLKTQKRRTRNQTI